MQLYVELSYILDPFGTRDSNGGDMSSDAVFKQYNDAHKNDKVTKHLSPYVRSNFSFVRKIGNKTLGQIITIADLIKNDKKNQRFVELASDVIDFILSHSEEVFPDVETKYPEQIEENWIDRFRFEKNRMEYHTNIFNKFNCEKNPELELLELLEKLIDEGYEENLNLTMHFNCWGYLLNGKLWYEHTAKDLIAHRKKVLNEAQS